MWEPGKSLKDHIDQILEECFLHHRGSRIHTANALDVCIRTVGNHLHKNPRLKEIYADESFRKAMRTKNAKDWLLETPPSYIDKDE